MSSCREEARQHRSSRMSNIADARSLPVADGSGGQARQSKLVKPDNCVLLGLLDPELCLRAPWSNPGRKRLPGSRHTKRRFAC